MRLLLEEGRRGCLELIGSIGLDESFSHRPSFVPQALLVAEELGFGRRRDSLIFLLEVQKRGLGLVLGDGKGLATGA